MPIACNNKMMSIKNNNNNNNNNLCGRSDSTAIIHCCEDDTGLEVVFEHGDNNNNDDDDDDCVFIEDEEDSDDDEYMDSRDESLEEGDRFEGEYSVEEEEGQEEEGGDNSSSSICQEAPFWYSYEDTEQINGIMNCYTTALKLDEERKTCIRAPPPFVGRVKRLQVDNDLFTTLDQVSVYLRDVRPLGTCLPFCRDAWMLTSWDVYEGIPLRSFQISKDSLLEFWQARSHGEYSYLFCRPMLKTAWEYTVSLEDAPIIYLSPLYSATHSFNLYLPKQPPRPSLRSSLEDIFVQ